MKKRWLVPMLLLFAAGVVGFGLTGEKAQEVHKISVRQARQENVGCGTMILNPLREESCPELSQAVKEYYGKLEGDAGFVESYNDIRVYTKLGKRTGTYIAFVRYAMKIQDIYTEIPGLGTLYVEQDEESGQYEIKSGEAAGIKDYAAEISAHEDVQNLFAEVNAEYAEAVASDALLREALSDLRDAYEGSAGK